MGNIRNDVTSEKRRLYLGEFAIVTLRDVVCCRLMDTFTVCVTVILPILPHDLYTNSTIRTHRVWRTLNSFQNTYKKMFFAQK